MFTKLLKQTSVTLVAAIVSVVMLQGSVLAYESNLHVFSVDDVMGGPDGSTFGTGGAQQNTDIICGIPGGATCPEGIGPIVDKAGVTLYPVDSKFGYYVVDFLGAQHKEYDDDYLEGFVGNIMDGTDVIGIKVSNAATETYKVKPPLGTWCQGLGGTSVKCETEHYTVMEHVLSCHEIIPYFFADPLTGEQAELSTPDGSMTFDCANAPLDDYVLIIDEGFLTDTRLVSSVPCEEEVINPDGTTSLLPEGCQIFPNDKTDMQNDIGLSTDYSVQLKDDGKALYGWGGLHKRPNDIRMYARLELPAQWKAPDAPAEGYTVTRAELVVNHWITNNPNDQLRPEDLENEGAMGRKPSYRIEGTIGGEDEVWKSTIPCYEGDGDIIDTEDGAIDPTFIPVGTVFKNKPFALDPAAEPGILPEDDPYVFSSDLRGAMTNAFYTTINRDPFEWSYDADPDPMVQDYVGSPFPDDTLGELVSGPRWRLKANKFGQDLPGLDIPLIECSPPPFQSDNIKYKVGTPVTTVINLLDWNEAKNGPSPLANSKGWVDVEENLFVEIMDEVNGIPISTNGLPMTEDFDLAVYVKGDRKSTAVFNAQLIIEYEGEVTEDEFDLAIDDLEVPVRISVGDDEEVEVTIVNNGPDAASGTVTLIGTVRGAVVAEFTGTFTDLLAGMVIEYEWDWTPSTQGTVTWTAVVAAPADEDPDETNNTATAVTRVRR